MPRVTTFMIMARQDQSIATFSLPWAFCVLAKPEDILEDTVSAPMVTQMILLFDAIRLQSFIRIIEAPEVEEWWINADPSRLVEGKMPQ